MTTLPPTGLVKIWGGPAANETCAICARKVPKGTPIIEGICASNIVYFFHIECFYAWDQQLPRTVHPVHNHVEDH